MRKLLLFALIGLVLLYTLSFREGVDDTLTKEPGCPPGYALQGGSCRIEYGTAKAGGRCEQGKNEGGKCVDTRPPICPNAYVFETEGPFGKYKCITGAAVYKNRIDRAALTDPTSEYNANEFQDALQGPLPAPINETAPPLDADASRSSIGPVFGDNGPFSGQAGTGQGSGMNAAATLTGSSYTHPPPTQGRLDPYDFWPGTKGNSGARKPVLSGTNMDVQGPTWGGRASGSTNSAPASVMTAKLYGPTGGNKASGFGSGHPQINSVDTSMLPDYRTTGSDPSNQYAVTSRVPGDQDLFATPYLQSTTYSLANGGQKTNPVPYLDDFSAFQS